jgi:acyl carrier protein
MVTMDREAMKHEIKQIIIAELDLRDRSESEIVDSAPLFGEGLGLDSLDALQLAMALEERFGVQIPEGEEAKQVFASVEAIADYIARAQAA